MLGGISNSKCKCVKNHGQRLLLLSTGAMKGLNLASSLCKIRREKHLSAFVELVDGREIYTSAY
jgi:hypothetical protein